MSAATREAMTALGAAALLLLLKLCAPAFGHSWYPGQCCSGFDCRPIDGREVDTREGGFYIHESRELIPYSDPRIRKTPPEGDDLFHRCSKGGKPDGETICLYIPNWGA